MKNIVDYEKRKSDQLVLSSIPFACCLIAGGIGTLLGEKPPLFLLGVTFFLFVLGLYSHVQQKHQKADQDQKHDA